jgi:hypothetical protein
VNLLSSELLKMRTTRTNLWLAISMVGLVLLFVLLQALLTNRFDIELASKQRELLATGGIAALFAALVGLLAITSEFRHGTIRPTFLFTPRRERVVGTKLVASLLLGLTLGAVAEGLAFGVGFIVLAARGASLTMDTNDILLVVFGTLGMSALWAALGVGVGAVVRNQVLGIIGVIVWLFIVENIIYGLAPSVGRFGPGQAGAAMTGDPSENLLSPGVGALVLIGWVAVAGALGLFFVAHRDV